MVRGYVGTYKVTIGKKEGVNREWAYVCVSWMPEVFLSLSDGILRSGERNLCFRPLRTSLPCTVWLTWKKRVNLMRDITYQSASLVPTVHSSCLLWCQIQKFSVHIKKGKKNQIWNLDAKVRSWILADVYNKTVEPTELFLPSKPRFPGLCSVLIVTSGHCK